MGVIDDGLLSGLEIAACVVGRAVCACGDEICVGAENDPDGCAENGPDGCVEMVGVKPESEAPLIALICPEKPSI